MKVAGQLWRMGDEMHDWGEKRLAANGYKQVPAEQEQECQSRNIVTGTVAIYCDLMG